MKKFGKPLILLLLLFSLSLTFVSAFCTWYFLDEISGKVEPIGSIGDYLRPNYTFGDEEDTVLRDVNYYNVYFLAQNVQKIENFLEEDGLVDGVTNYRFKAIEEGIYYENDVENGSLKFGTWGDRSESPYYRRFSRISAITTTMIDEMGRPSCSLIDGNSNINGEFYLLDFACWSIDPYDIYARSTEHSANDTYIQVYGTYPYANFEIAYFNILLEYYDAESVLIDGEKTLFFYPIYTVGKDYYSIRTGQDSENLRDSISISCQGGDLFFTYDEKYAKLMNAKGLKDADASNEQTRYRAYRYQDYRVTSSNLNDEYGKIRNHIDEVNGSWVSEKQEIETEQGVYSLNEEIGRYNIYLFVKERYMSASSSIDPNSLSPDFTADEIEALKAILDEQSLHIYSSLQPNYHSVGKSYYYYTYYCDTRGYYIAIEKVYESRLIGGITGDFDYQNPISRSLCFTKNGLDGEKINAYDLRNLTLSCNEGEYSEIEYSPEGKANSRKMRIPNYYFAVQLNEDNAMAYDQRIRSESETITYEVPAYRYLDKDGRLQTENYRSEELLISLKNAVFDDLQKRESGLELRYKDIERIQVTKADSSESYYTLREYIERGKKGEEGFIDYLDLIDSLKLVRPIDSGTYNLYAYVDYHIDENGCEVPYAVDLWAYRIHNIFVNIYDPDDFGGISLNFDGTYLSSDAIGRYSFQCDSYYYLETDLRYEDDGTAKRYIRGYDLPDLDGVQDYDFLSILTWYDAQGKCFQDIVTGRYITVDNVQSNPFVVRKNYILQVVSKP